MEKKEFSNELIREKIKEFTWYSPVSFGDGIVAEGNFKIRIDPESIHFGLGKWRFIVERNLPDLQGKKVLDIGCNNGVFCLQMARAGAREVVGVDSNETWARWKEQAEFVKESLEWRCRSQYPIHYIDAKMENIPNLGLGKIDVVVALCCLYYLSENDLRALLKHFRDNASYILIQCNTRESDQIPDVHRKAQPLYMVNALREAGFPHIRTDEPWFYERPVVVGSLYPFAPRVHASKIDRIRYWIRSRV